MPTDSKKMAVRMRTTVTIPRKEFVPSAVLEPIKMQAADTPMQKNIRTRRVLRMPVTVRM